MQAFVMFFLVVVAILVSNGVYSLPAINFTDSEVPNQIIKTLSEALATQDVEEQQQQAAEVNPRSYYYPYSYQNLNWYNFPYLWPAVAGGLLNPIAPLAGIGCPTGFCPSGASCSQYSGQWQCGCGLNGCGGSKFS